MAQKLSINRINPTPATAVDLSTKQDKLTSANAGNGIDITTDASGKVTITNNATARVDNQTTQLNASDQIQVKAVLNKANAGQFLGVWYDSDDNLPENLDSNTIYISY